MAAAGLAKELGVNLITGLSKAEAASRSKNLKKEPQKDGWILHLARVKRDGVYSTIPTDQLVVGDVIWLAAGDVCAVEAHVLTEGAVVKSLKGSRIASEIFLAGDRVESGCGEALVVQPARSSSVLKVKVEQLLMVQPAQRLRKSGTIPSTLKIERPPSVAVSDARRATALSTMACIIVGMRGIITLDRTIVESIYVDGTHLNATDAAALKAKASIASSPCALLLTASLLCNTNNLDRSQFELNDSVLPAGAIITAASMRLHASLGLSISDISAAFTRLASQEVASSKLTFSIHKRSSPEQCIVFVRGDFTHLRSRCASILKTSGNDVMQETSETAWKAVAKHAKELSLTNEYVSAYAMKSLGILDEKLTEAVFAAKDFVLLGLVASSDPIRELAAESLGSFEALKMRVILATNESESFARVAARKAGFLTEDTREDIAEKNGIMPGEVDPKAAQALVSGSGTLLSGLHGNELDDALLLRQLVFANAYLVDAMKQRGDSVGVVLESSKDVDAAQRSDVSFAFQCSPDACKEVANMVSLNDSLSSLAYAMNEARNSNSSPAKTAEKKEACLLQ